MTNRRHPRMTKEISDQLKFAKEGADNLARRNGYEWVNWLKGTRGICTAGFEREGERWSLDFSWTPNEPLELLANKIEQMDYCMVACMKEFGALKLGAAMRHASEAGIN